MQHIRFLISGIRKRISYFCDCSENASIPHGQFAPLHITFHFHVLWSLPALIFICFAYLRDAYVASVRYELALINDAEHESNAAAESARGIPEPLYPQELDKIDAFMGTIHAVVRDRVTSEGK